MPSIRITQFAGLLPEVNRESLRTDHAQIAHNCLLQDGWLRPMPQWQVVQNYVSQPKSLIKNHAAPLGVFPEFDLEQAIYKPTEPYLFQFTGLINGSVYRRFPGVNSLAGIPVPNPTNITQVITNTNLSRYPIPRTYAITFLSGKAEGPPFVFPQLGNDGTLFEGDVVTISATIDLTPFAAYGLTGIRLYRTVPGFDTGEQIGNPLETGFHLVEEGSIFSFQNIINYNVSDPQDSSRIPGDLLLTDQFMDIKKNQFPTDFIRDTESGWLCAIGNQVFGNGPATILFSERYLWHAWPPQNMVLLDQAVKDVAVFYDDIFLGTSSEPYHIKVGQGSNDSLDIVVKPFRDDYACIPNSMVTTNFGAMYACRDGLIALQADGDSVISKRVTNPGDQLGGQSIRIDSVLRATWWNGSYYGFCANAGYVFTSLSKSNNDFPLSQLTTLDIPPGVAGVCAVSGSGIFALWGNILYTLPMPGYGYDNAPKATYTWKSKRFVLPGLFTMAAAKVVNDGSGTLNFALYGDDVLIISRPVTSSEPFRIPHQHKCIEWELILSGTSVVNEVHVATSIRDLIEEPK